MDAFGGKKRLLEPAPEVDKFAEDLPFGAEVVDEIYTAKGSARRKVIKVFKQERKPDNDVGDW